MEVIAASQEWLAQHGYAVRRTGPIEWTVFDTESESGKDAPVCKGRSHADAVRALLAARFSD